MFTYEYDQLTGVSTTKEDEHTVAQLHINSDVFEQLDGEEMSDGEIEMHCEGMYKEYDRIKELEKSFENDITQ